MSPAITRTGRITILLLILAGVADLPFTPLFQQQRNMWRAEQHAKTLRPLLQADPRFKRVNLEGFTGAGGSFMVIGMVANDNDRQALRDLVTASKPPVRVVFSVQTDAELQKMRDALSAPAETPPGH